MAYEDTYVLETIAQGGITSCAIDGHKRAPASALLVYGLREDLFAYPRLAPQQEIHGRSCELPQTSVEASHRRRVGRYGTEWAASIRSNRRQIAPGHASVHEHVRADEDHRALTEGPLAAQQLPVHEGAVSAAEIAYHGGPSVEVPDAGMRPRHVRIFGSGLPNQLLTLKGHSAEA